MANFESASLCTVQEYNKHIQDRLDLATIQQDELMVLMILLNGVHEAAKLPVRMLEKTTPKGLLHVEVAFVDNNLRTRHKEIFAAENDFLIVQDKLNVNYDEMCSQAVECYARDYFEDQMPPDFFDAQSIDASKLLIEA